MSADELQLASSAAPAPGEAWFGRRLRQLRMARGLTLRSFARKIGVSEAYLSLVERGRMAPPSVEISSRMARVLETDADDFLAAAGRVSPDVAAIILQRPAEMSRLIRAARRWSEAQWAALELDFAEQNR